MIVFIELHLDGVDQPTVLVNTQKIFTIRHTPPHISDQGILVRLQDGDKPVTIWCPDTYEDVKDQL